MAKLYNFIRLIDKYSEVFTVEVEKGGMWDGGIYSPAEPEIHTMKGAIVPLGENKLYHLGGAYTEQDRELYSHTRIPDSLMQGTVHHKGKTYTIENETDYDAFADAYIYRLKRVNINDTNRG